MVKLLIWLAGAIGFLFAIDTFGFWHEAVALAVLAAAFVWIIGGGLWVARGSRGAARHRAKPSADAAALRKSALQNAVSDLRNEVGK